VLQVVKTEGGQDLSPFMELEEIPPDDINEQTADMIEELQSVTPNPDIAGKYVTKLLRQAIKL
jgi:hypothetical protein